ncbi:hypothetical protein SLEP1_g4345 [Rubroshorea leprosula]|uniref:Uncharacterized protein n=1 Tax=Rubroshorea leprosula TaxID=152421 RepID=A0AAV5HSR5_9ROSI|nr:hypothetical protein SLEP1_g4345 [Rubroshorea leprosula]
MKAKRAMNLGHKPRSANLKAKPRQLKRMETKEQASQKVSSRNSGPFLCDIRNLQSSSNALAIDERKRRPHLSILK